MHALTWFHSSLIEHTCNHLPPPFISSLTSVTHRLVLRLHGCSSLHWSMSSCLPVYPWNSSLPVDTQVYKQLILFILLPEHSSLSLFCWKPFLSYFNKFPFDLHLPVCRLWPVPWQLNKRTFNKKKPFPFWLYGPYWSWMLVLVSRCAISALSQVWSLVCNLS